MGLFYISLSIVQLVPTVYLQTFSSIGQSPCDVAAELASVCVGGSAFYCLVSFSVVRTDSKV